MLSEKKVQRDYRTPTINFPSIPEFGEQRYEYEVKLKTQKPHKKIYAAFADGILKKLT